MIREKSFTWIAANKSTKIIPRLEKPTTLLK